MSENGNGKTWVDVLSSASKPLLSLVKTCGPFILSQSKSMQGKYEDFILNKAKIEALSEFIKDEINGISKEREKIRSSMSTLSGLERVTAQNNYDLLSKEINKLSTIEKIKHFFSENEKTNPTEDISDSWSYRFNEIASSLNEEWRKELLAKAFAKEIKNPGTVSVVLLNAIASFDEKTFRYFGSIIDVSIRLYEVNLLNNNITKKSFSINGEAIGANKIFYELSHLNLINPSSELFVDIKDDSEVLFRYGRRVIRVRRKSQGVKRNTPIYFLTSSGNQIAELYDRKTTELGNDLLNSYIEDLKSNGHTCVEQLLSEEEFQFFGN